MTWLNGQEAHGLIGRFPLTEYRVDQEGDGVKVTMTATEPTGLVRFLRFDRMWPEFWEFVRADRPASAEQSEAVSSSTLRAHWRRTATA